jgi:hypothetical protein
MAGVALQRIASGLERERLLAGGTGKDVEQVLRNHVDIVFEGRGQMAKKSYRGFKRMNADLRRRIRGFSFPIWVDPR